nr:MAG TPA: hypothetical protein [Caudoviricetes sp.]
MVRHGRVISPQLLLQLPKPIPRAFLRYLPQTRSAIRWRV